MTTAPMTLKDRLASAATDEWESTRILADRTGYDRSGASGPLLVAENEQTVEHRTTLIRAGLPGARYNYEWRRGPRWQEAYG